MKVAVIFLDYQRHDYTERVRNQNLNNSGYPFSLITVDRKGIAAAINEGIIQARGHDAIVTMANDILMPEGWLAHMVRAALAIPNTGMCGIHCVESLPDMHVINGIPIHPNDAAFGNVLIPFNAIAQVGYFNEGHDPYGMQDHDYGLRLKMAGFVSYYLNGLKSEHIGHDVGQQTDYRRMKDEGLQVAGRNWSEWTRKYAETGDYTIFYPEYPELSAE